MPIRSCQTATSATVIRWPSIRGLPPRTPGVLTIRTRSGGGAVGIAAWLLRSWVGVVVSIVFILPGTSSGDHSGQLTTLVDHLDVVGGLASGLGMASSEIR